MIVEGLFICGLSRSQGKKLAQARTPMAGPNPKSMERGHESYSGDTVSICRLQLRRPDRAPALAAIELGGSCAKRKGQTGEVSGLHSAVRHCVGGERSVSDFQANSLALEVNGSHPPKKGRTAQVAYQPSTTGLSAGHRKREIFQFDRLRANSWELGA